MWCCPVRLILKSSIFHGTATASSERNRPVAVPAFQKSEGIIIAATEEERVGVFHEASYNMIKNGLRQIVVYPEDVPKYLGVKNGVDMTIVHNNKIVGGIGVTGLPEVSIPWLQSHSIRYREPSIPDDRAT